MDLRLPARRVVAQLSSQPAQAAVPGFTDAHAHLLRQAAGVDFPAGASAVRAFRQRVASGQLAVGRLAGRGAAASPGDGTATIMAHVPPCCTRCPA
ncbi:MAG: hypothetical protein ACLP70_13165 [Streptosporangiaceae bacterium]